MRHHESEKNLTILDRYIKNGSSAISWILKIKQINQVLPNYFLMVLADNFRKRLQIGGGFRAFML